MSSNIQIPKQMRKNEQLLGSNCTFLSSIQSTISASPPASTKRKPTNVIRIHKLALFTTCNATVLSWQFFILFWLIAFSEFFLKYCACFFSRYYNSVLPLLVIKPISWAKICTEIKLYSPNNNT